VDYPGFLVREKTAIFDGRTKGVDVKAQQQAEFKKVVNMARVCTLGAATQTLAAGRVCERCKVGSQLDGSSRRETGFAAAAVELGVYG
jgi:hypothetical protein